MSCSGEKSSGCRCQGLFRLGASRISRKEEKKSNKKERIEERKEEKKENESKRRALFLRKGERDRFLLLLLRGCIFNGDWFHFFFSLADAARRLFGGSSCIIDEARILEKRTEASEEASSILDTQGLPERSPRQE